MSAARAEMSIDSLLVQLAAAWERGSSTEQAAALPALRLIYQRAEQAVAASGDQKPAKPTTPAPPRTQTHEGRHQPALGEAEAGARTLTSPLRALTASLRAPPAPMHPRTFQAQDLALLFWYQPGEYVDGGYVASDKFHSIVLPLRRPPALECAFREKSAGGSTLEDLLELRGSRQLLRPDEAYTYTQGEAKAQGLTVYEGSCQVATPKYGFQVQVRCKDHGARYTNPVIVTLARRGKDDLGYYFVEQGLWLLHGEPEFDQRTSPMFLRSTSPPSDRFKEPHLYGLRVYALEPESLGYYAGIRSRDVAAVPSQGLAQTLSPAPLSPRGALLYQAEIVLWYVARPADPAQW